MFTKEQRKGNFEKPQKFNEFSKLIYLLIRWQVSILLKNPNSSLHGHFKEKYLNFRNTNCNKSNFCFFFKIYIITNNDANILDILKSFT